MAIPQKATSRTRIFIRIFETDGKTALHCTAFNAKVFGHKNGNGQIQNTSKSLSKAFSQAEYDKRLHVLDPENWGVGKLKEMFDHD